MHLSYSAILFLVIFTLGSLLSLLKDPFWGLLMYVHVYFNTPQHHFWAENVPNFRWALIAAAILVVSCILHWNRLSPVRVTRCWSFRFLALLFVYMICQTPFGPYPDTSLHMLYEFLRYIVIFIITIKVINNNRQFKIFAAFWLIECLLLSRLAFHYFQGDRLEFGIADADTANQAASFMAMSLPLCLSFWIGKSWRMRLLPLVVAPFLVNAFMMYRSRGAFVGLFMSGATLLLSLRYFQENRKHILIALIAGAIAVIILIDPHYVQRVLTLTQEQPIQASAGRWEIWKSSIPIIMQYPFGAGGGSFMILSTSYLPSHLLPEGMGSRASHNTYLQVLTEHGFPGLLLYLAFVISTLLALHRQRKRITSNIKTKPDTCLADHSLLADNVALFCSIVSILAASFFQDRLYFLSIYWFAALAIVVSNLDTCENHSDSQCTS